MPVIKSDWIRIDVNSGPSDEDLDHTPCKIRQFPARTRNVMECTAWIGQIQRTFGVPFEGNVLSIVDVTDRNGTHREVAVFYDPNSRDAEEYARAVELKAPAKWDQASIRELTSDGVVPPSPVRSSLNDIRELFVATMAQLDRSYPIQILKPKELGGSWRYAIRRTGCRDRILSVRLDHNDMQFIVALFEQAGVKWEYSKEKTT